VHKRDGRPGPDRMQKSKHARDEAGGRRSALASVAVGSRADRGCIRFDLRIYLMSWNGKNGKGAFVNAHLCSGAKASSLLILVHPSERRAWDSNPQVLSDNGFQGRESRPYAVLTDPSRCLLSQWTVNSSLLIPPRLPTSPERNGRRMADQTAPWPHKYNRRCIFVAYPAILPAWTTGNQSNRLFRVLKAGSWAFLLEREPL